MKAEATYKS